MCVCVYGGGFEIHCKTHHTNHTYSSKSGSVCGIVDMVITPSAMNYQPRMTTPQPAWNKFSLSRIRKPARYIAQPSPVKPSPSQSTPLYRKAFFSFRACANSVTAVETLALSEAEENDLTDLRLLVYPRRQHARVGGWLYGMAVWWGNGA